MIDLNKTSIFVARKVGDAGGDMDCCFLQLRNPRLFQVLPVKWTTLLDYGDKLK